MSLAKIKKNDQVIILAGKDKGKTGVVLQVFAKKVLVEGINLATFHKKANPNTQEEGGIQKKELPIAISNIARYDTTSGKAMKLGVKVCEDAKKVLFDKKTDKTIEN